MAKGDVILTTIALEAHDSGVLAKMVTDERKKRDQVAAKAHYVAVFVPRVNTHGYTRYIAFVEFMVEEK
jgi:hypothetical protein